MDTWFTMVYLLKVVDLSIVPTCSNNQIQIDRRLPGILLFLRRHELHHLHRDAGLLRVDGAAGRAQRLHSGQRRHVAQAQQGEVERGLAQATQVVPLVVGLLAALGPGNFEKVRGKTWEKPGQFAQLIL